MNKDSLALQVKAQSETTENTSDDGCTLSISQIEQNLSILGVHPFSLAHIYTTVDISSLQLVNLCNLSQFPNVMHVNCAQNLLSTLAPLRNLNLLQTLNASENRLEQFLGSVVNAYVRKRVIELCAIDFDIARCSAERAWDGGKDWIGSVLRCVQLESNRITRIRSDLSAAHPFLVELYLAHNKIEDIEGIDGLRFLKVLDLSFNVIKSTRGLCGSNYPEQILELHALEKLLLSNNELNDLSGLEALPRLMILDLSHNRLSILSSLKNCHYLQKLNISHNLVETYNELNCLRQLQYLYCLEADANPFRQQYSHVIHCARVLRRLQQIVLLDGEEISDKQKVKALVMHGFENRSRKKVFTESLFNGESVDMPILQFEEDSELSGSDAWYDSNDEDPISTSVETER